MGKKTPKRTRAKPVSRGRRLGPPPPMGPPSPPKIPRKTLKKFIPQDEIKQRQVRINRLLKQVRSLTEKNQKLKSRLQRLEQVPFQRREATKRQQLEKLKRWSRPIPAEKVLAERFETRARCNLIFRRGESTPTTIGGVIFDEKIRSLNEALKRVGIALIDAAKSGAQGNAPPWFGTLNMNGSGENVPQMGKIIILFSRNPDRRMLGRLLRELRKKSEIQIIGEITIQWRRIVRFKNQLGNEVERFFVAKGRPQVRFIIGEEIDESLTETFRIKHGLQHKRKPRLLV